MRELIVHDQMEVEVQAALNVPVSDALVVAVQTIEIIVTVDERRVSVQVSRQVRVRSTVRGAEHQAGHDDDGLSVVLERLTHGLLENTVCVHVLAVGRDGRRFRARSDSSGDARVVDDYAVVLEHSATRIGRVKTIYEEHFFSFGFRVGMSLRFTVAVADAGKMFSFSPPEMSVTAVVDRCNAFVPGLPASTTLIAGLNSHMLLITNRSGNDK